MHNIIATIVAKRHTHTETKHYAAIIPHGMKLAGAFGENYHINGPIGSIHAEHDAIQRFTRNISRGKHPIKVDFLVIRLSKTGVFGISRPCGGCLFRMKKISDKSFFDIRYVYYSSDDNMIVREKFSEMIESPIQYQSSGIRNKVRKWKFDNK